MREPVTVSRERRGGQRAAPSQLVAPLLAVGVYIVLACLRFWPTAPWSPHTLPVCNCADYAKMTAFLEWTPWAIVHGHNPFYTTYQDFPSGVNLATNTTMPLLGILFAPVSLTAGPIVAMNLLARLAFASAAASAFFVLRRWVSWTPAAFLGGLLFGFSTYMTHHSMGHPNLIVIALLPVLLLLLDEILIRQRWRARTAGLALGLVAAAQYSISSELLADAVMLAVVGIPALALWRSELVRERVKYVARALAWSLLAFLVLVGYPIWMVLAGPGHLTGPLVSLAAADKYRSDLLGAVLPTRVELLSLGSLGAQGSRFAVNLAENATYIGVPLLALVAGLTIAFRRDTRLRFASLAALSCYVVSLGSTLDINGDATSLALPYRILEHIPLLDSALAVRFSVFGYLFVALALALGLDHLSRKRELARPPLVAGLLGVVALVPLVPRTLPLAARSYAVPAFFSSAHALDTIPSGSPILVYPYSTDGYLSYSVLWQAVAAFRFKLTSGDVTYRGPHGGAAPEGPPLNPPLLENLLLYAFDGRDAAEARGNLALRPGSLAQIRLALARYHFTTVVAAPVGDHPSVVVATLTRALRRAPIRREGVLVWYGVQHDLRAIGAT